MKKFLVVLFLVILIGSVFVACDKQKDEYAGEVQMKPFASPDPNNPYDEKLPMTYTIDDITDWKYIFVELTNSESINNLFYDYKITDFGIKPAYYDDQKQEYLKSNNKPVLKSSYRRINNSDYTILEEIREKVKNGEAIDFTTYTRNLIIVFSIEENDEENLTNADVVEYVDYLNSLEYVRLATPYTSSLIWFSYTPSGYEPGETYAWGKEIISIRDAWEKTTGSPDVKVGVIDSGIRTTHYGLYNKWDSSIGYGTDYNSDMVGHGTSVTGIMFTNGYDGIYGVCYGAKYVSLRANIGAGNEDITLVTNAINYAQQNSIKVLNFSGGFYANTVTTTEINQLYNAISNYDGLLIVAAGNENSNLDTITNKLYPQCFDLDNIIVVGGSSISDTRLSYSNYGLNTVDLFAPGNSIYTTVNTNDYSMDNFSGTSASAPFVTGVAALIVSYYPNISMTEVKARLLYGVDDISALNGYCATGGRLNANKALHSHNFSQCIYVDNTFCHGDCTLCGYDKDITHLITGENLGLFAGHRLYCQYCGHSFGTQAHDWQIHYIGITQYRVCRGCGLNTLFDDTPIPHLSIGIREELEEYAQEHGDDFIYPITEHIAIICEKGRYGLLIECDENGKPLSALPKELFESDEYAEAYQKELDKKVEDILALQKEQKKPMMSC